MCHEIPPQEQFKIDLLEEALKRYQEQYNELCVIWRNLENKAQAILAISGVLITASGLLIKEVGQDLPSTMNLFLALSIILLSFSVIFSIQVLRLREVNSSPTGKGYKRLALDLIENVENETEIAERKVNLIHDKINLWEHSVKSRKRECKDKSNYLKSAQYLLLASLILISILKVTLVSINQL